MTKNINAIKGMKDLLDERARLYESIIKVCEEVARNYGFEFINTPHLEFTTLFKRSVGESSDIVGKEMYEFIDKGQNAVCLRPEGTAGVVRAYIEQKFDKIGAIKRWFYHGSMFRYERPQRGRLREFHQFGVESFGVNSVFEDATLILMLSQILKNLGINASLKINSLGCTKCMSEFRKNFLDFVENSNNTVNFSEFKDGTKDLKSKSEQNDKKSENDEEQGFCEDCLRRKELNPIRMLDCKNEHCQALLKNAPTLRECLCAECKSDFELLQSLLRENGVEFKLDDRLVRGLDYYCKSAFEFESEEIGAKAAVAGGGRYDRLIEFLGGKSGYGVGFALGVERLMEILAQKKQEGQRKGLYLCVLNEPYLKGAFFLATALRKHFCVNLSYEAKKLARHLSVADTSGAKIFLCIGENEAKNESVFYKNLENKDEKTIKICDLQDFLRQNA